MTAKGDAPEKILEIAAGDPSALIAMTTRGRSGVTRLLLGSVTAGVLRETRGPILIVRARKQAPPESVATVRTLITPVDGSPHAELALPHTADVAKALGASVLLVHVTPVVQPDGHATTLARGRAERLYRQLDSLAESYLDDLSADLDDKGVTGVRGVIVQGEPADAIRRITKETPDCMVVMATHGRSAIGRLLHGSVTDVVVRESFCPVLAVRADTE